MDEQETEIIEPRSNGTAPAATLLESLRERRTLAANDRTHDVLVPRYGGRVALRCGPVSGQTQARLLERTRESKDPDRDFNLNADWLIAACREVMVRDSYHEPWQSLGALNGGEPVKLDETLAELLALEPAAKTAREVLRALFSLAPSPELAITLAGSEYVGWAGAVNEELDEEFVGESSSAGK